MVKPEQLMATLYAILTFFAVLICFAMIWAFSVWVENQQNPEAYECGAIILVLAFGAAVMVYTTLSEQVDKNTEVEQCQVLK